MLTCCVDAKPCCCTAALPHTPRGNTTSTCDALEFIPAAASPELCALALTHGVPQAWNVPGTLDTHRTRLFPFCTSPEAVQEGKASSLQPFHPAWAVHSQGTAREWLMQPQCRPGYTERVTGGLNTCSSPGFSLPRGTESSSDQTQRVKDLYPLQFVFLN